MTAMNLRKVGGSVAVVIPPMMLEELNLNAGSTVDISIKNKQIQIKPIAKKPRYSLADLLAQTDYEAVRQATENETNAWLNAPAVGRELL